MLFFQEKKFSSEIDDSALRVLLTWLQVSLIKKEDMGQTPISVHLTYIQVHLFANIVNMQTIRNSQLLSLSKEVRNSPLNLTNLV